MIFFLKIGEALRVELSARATLSATSCWQPLKKAFGRRSAAVFWRSAALMVPNVVFTRSRWGCREASQAQRREEKGKEAPGAPRKT